MGKINLLESNVFNRIAAGEVVERPASIVKELIENSIDAGANQITVEIIGGGIDCITITDNGSGIELDSVELAFMPHATSKISTADDLENISTLGFRGEALPSIASVSIVELTTKSQFENIGTKIVYRGGLKESSENIDYNVGTKICVRNIFFNTPARQKFLKKPKGEEAEITYVISGLIIANPNVSFKYFADSKLIYSTAGNGLEDCIYAVYSAKTAQNLIPVNHQIYNITVKGYTSLPCETKSNRTYQYTVVNGRLINNATINTAVMQAYGNRLMKRMFPVFALDIIMPFDLLDVNVTPSKTDVRFVNTKEVFSAVYHAVEKALLNHNNLFTLQDNQMLNRNETNKDSIEITTEVKQLVKNDNFTHFKAFQQNSNNIIADIASDTLRVDKNVNKVLNAKETIINDNNSNNNITDKKSDDDFINYLKAIPPDKSIEDTPILKNSNRVRDSFASAVKTRPPKNFETQSTLQQSTLFDDVENLLINDFTIVGQLFSTFLLVSKDTDLFIIDQHAVHEKFLYDKYTNQLLEQNIITQALLIPEIIELSPNDSSYLATMIDDFKKIGLDIEEFGINTFKISSVPILLNNFKLKPFIDEVLRDKNKNNTIKLKDILHDNLAILACKAAIKSGDSLSETQIKGLLDTMKDNIPMQCPHGRPAIVKITRKDIDKLFKRIL